MTGCLKYFRFAAGKGNCPKSLCSGHSGLAAQVLAGCSSKEQCLGWEAKRAANSTRNPSIETLSMSNSFCSSRSDDSHDRISIQLYLFFGSSLFWGFRIMYIQYHIFYSRWLVEVRCTGFAENLEALAEITRHAPSITAESAKHLP